MSNQYQSPQAGDLPKRLPLVVTPENRGADTTKDSKLVNCYTERIADGSYWLYKRPGLTYTSQPPGTAANGYGLYNWLGDVYSIFGSVVYKNGAAIPGTVDATNGVYRFTSCLGAAPKLIFGNGTASYTYNAASGILAIAGANFPTPAVKGWAYLDGWIFVLDAAANIHGCDVANTPDTWTDTLNKLVAQIEPDAGIGLIKQLVYAVACKQWSTEVFYDAGNATGSPLAPVQGAKVNYGCRAADSIRQIDEGTLMWLSTNRSAGTQVIKMEGLKAEVVSTDPVERLLEKLGVTTIYSFALKTSGHRFYVLTSVLSNITLVYDLDSRMWHQWTDTDGNYFPFVDVTYNASSQVILQHATNGKLYVMDNSYYTDAGDSIMVDIVTPNFDGEINRRKQMNLMKFIADQVPGSILHVRKNDNDYAADKWSNFRQVDLSHKQPMLTNCGAFVRRAHHFRHQSQTAFRLKAIELQMDLGTL